MRRLLMLTVGLGLITGCATADGSASSGGSTDVRAARGQTIAEHECGQCHGLGLDEESARIDAPPFRNIRLRYNDLSFRRRMQEIAEGGHLQMPPLRLEESDVRDVAAYIESLERQ